MMKKIDELEWGDVFKFMESASTLYLLTNNGGQSTPIIVQIGQEKGTDFSCCSWPELGLLRLVQATEDVEFLFNICDLYKESRYVEGN